MDVEATTPVIVDAVRTPQAHKDGTLAELFPEDLVTTVLDALAERTGIEPSSWDEFRLGCANQEEVQGRNLARQVLLAGGYPESIPAITENQLCGSSLSAIVDAARAVSVGDAEIVPVAGVEMMSRVSFSDWLHPDLVDRYGSDSLSMGQTAERIARKHGIDRDAQDRFALRSQERATEAWEQGRFDDEVVPVETPNGTAATDETHRPETSLEKLNDLPTTFREDGKATVTPGNASPLTDGAAGVLVTSAAVARYQDLDILARIGERALEGVDPTVMGRGPIPATREVLSGATLSIEDLDLVELNEAFAAQAIHCRRELSIPVGTLNPNGGAIALGHPLGCSGARITTTLLHELVRTDGQYGIATMCVGFGQGVAVLFERA